MSTAADRVAEFRHLHESGTFVMPNPWDAGSSRLLAGLGFRALATTSAGFAWTLGVRDTKVTLDQALDHLQLMAGSVDVPFNADFEHGFADDPETVGANVSKAVTTGIAGISIEDSTGDDTHPLYEFDAAVERVHAARRAIDASGTGVLLTGRCESYLVGMPDRTETIRRLVAYAEAGAECLYAPGIRDLDDIAAVVSAVAPLPVNVLVGSDFTTVAALANLGVRRISVGGALARAALGAAVVAGREMLEQGTFTELAKALPWADAEAAMRERS